jgi:hypothetical protein
MPQLYANLSKNASIPSVSGGILWADDVNKMFHLFGGEYTQNPTNDFSLYSYDAINDYWTTPSRAPPPSIQGVSYGAGIAVSEKGEGYYYGGWLSSASEAGCKQHPVFFITILSTNSSRCTPVMLRLWFSGLRVPRNLLLIHLL